MKNLITTSDFEWKFQDNENLLLSSTRSFLIITDPYLPPHNDFPSGNEPYPSVPHAAVSPHKGEDYKRGIPPFHLQTVDTAPALAGQCRHTWSAGFESLYHTGLNICSRWTILFLKYVHFALQSRHHIFLLGIYDNIFF